MQTPKHIMQTPARPVKGPQPCVLPRFEDTAAGKEFAAGHSLVLEMETTFALTKNQKKLLSQYTKFVDTFVNKMTTELHRKSGADAEDISQVLLFVVKDKRDTDRALKICAAREGALGDKQIEPMNLAADIVVEPRGSEVAIVEVDTGSSHSDKKRKLEQNQGSDLVLVSTHVEFKVANKPLVNFEEKNKAIMQRLMDREAQRVRLVECEAELAKYKLKDQNDLWLHAIERLVKKRTGLSVDKDTLGTAYLAMLKMPCYAQNPGLMQDIGFVHDVRNLKPHQQVVKYERIEVVNSSRVGTILTGELFAKVLKRIRFAPQLCISTAEWERAVAEIDPLVCSDAVLV